MGMKLTICSEKEENNICLTNHTIKRYGKNLEEPDGKNEYLSGPILGLEFSGKVDIYDKSGEILELKKLTQWAKKTAHEKDVYKKLIVELNDISGNEYDSITLEKAFVVKYEQSFDGEKGEGEFYILIRSLDNMDDVFGQAWDRTAWDIDAETLIGNELQVERASRALGVEYTSILMEEDKFVKSLEQMNLKELEEKLKKLKFLETITKSSLFIPGVSSSMSSNMEMNLKYQSMIEKEINKRKQDMDLKEYQMRYNLDSNGNLISFGEMSRYSLKYINFIKSYETHNKNGDIHILDNGGKTIAYGHDLLSGENFDSGINEYQAINLLLDDLDKKYNLISSKIDELNLNYNYTININDFTENELFFLIDFAFNRGMGLYNRQDLLAAGKPSRSLTLLIIAVSEKNDDKIIEILMEETLNTKGIRYNGLVRRRMDEYEIYKFGEYNRNEDLDRNYTKN